MSLARGKFGIEYNPRQMDDESSGLGWIVAAVAVVALISLTWTLVGRFRAAREERQTVEWTAVVEGEATHTNALPAVSEPAAPVVVRSTYAHRPVVVRNLLM